MEVEKRGAKGGFFQLFDWNGKSRKKLFSSKSDLPESSSHGNNSYQVSVNARHQVLEKGYPLNTTCQNDYPYASFASGDSEQGTKAPGVVARLMGLDSLPTTNVNEPCFNPFAESNSFRDSSYLMASPAFHSEHDIVIFESVRNKLDGSSRNPLDLRLQKAQNRPLERFQREVLPPKSAKPISVTHNRLLSPIKSPGFIPPKNAAYIIEAAAKIIEQSPRATSKGKFPSLGSPSVPFRVRDLKEKMESAQRSSRSADVSQKSKDENCKNMKKQHNARGKGRLEDSHLFKGVEESKRASSQRLKSKEKPASLAVQVKSNIQKKDESTSGTKGSLKQKEHNVCVPRDPPNTQKKVEKQSSSRRPSEALRLNNQKQNRALAKDDNNEPSCSQPKERQESDSSANYINRRTGKTVNKIVVSDVVTSRKTNFVAADPGKEVCSLRAKANSKKKLSVNGNIQSTTGSVVQKAMVLKDEKSVKSNVTFEDDSKWDAIDKQSSLDVVSFTFTSPIKKSVRSNSILEATSSSSPNYDPCVHESDSRSSAASPSGFNVIGGDALSVLLEQKLKELASKVEISQKDMSGSTSLSCSVNNYGNMSPTVNLVESRHVDNDLCKSKLETQDASDSNSADKLWLQAERANKVLERIQGVSDSDSIQRYLHSQGSSTLLNQPSLSGASCDSFDIDRSSNEGPLPCLSLESCDGMSWRSTRKTHLTEGDPEISDTASSLSVGTMSETVSSSLYLVDPKDSSNWELKYIGDILSHAELLLEEFSLGQAHKIVAPDLFAELENQKTDYYKENVLERKVLFDFVCECLEGRCGKLLGGGFQFWGKQMGVLQRRQWLADDVYREASIWTNVDELMVDEVVEKDMSWKEGRWVEFESEAFEEGVDIGNRILTCLVDELIHDFLF